MCKWENARCLIDAKKTVDSLIFISLNEKKLSNLNLQEKCENLRQKFYINVCVVLDRVFSKNKKDICEHDSTINRIYYERDKHAAHKDEDYCPREYSSLHEEIEDKKSELMHVREVCKDILPEILTLDFVAHDKELFRYIFKISPDDEECIIKAKYPRVENEFCYIPENYDLLSDSDIEKRLSIIAKQFGLDSIKLNKKETWSADIVKELSDEDKKKIAYLIPDGLNSEEGLQNRQQACIYINIMFNQNIWVYPNDEVLDQIRNMKKDGILDEYEIVNWKVANKL